LQEDFAIAIGQTTVDGVAAHDGNGNVSVLSRGEFPDDGFGFLVDRVNGVRERGVDVKNTINDQWTTFVTTQDTSNLRDDTV